MALGPVLGLFFRVSSVMLSSVQLAIFKSYLTCSLRTSGVDGTPGGNGLSEALLTEGRIVAGKLRTSRLERRDASPGRHSAATLPRSA